MSESVVLVNHRGTPEPSPEIQRRLAAVHSHLFLKYIDGLPEHWAICLRWAEDDRRWQQVQAQVVDPSRSMDIVGYLPIGCGVEEAPAYLERSLRQYPKEDVQRIVDDLGRYNATAPLQQAMEQALVEVLDNPDPTGVEIKRPRGRPRKHF